MKQYLDFLTHTTNTGMTKSDRTGTGTTSVFGHQMRFNLSGGFPLVTTKKIHTKSVIAELLWMLSGSTNVKDLQAMGCTIWDEWADEDGDLGPVYGAQWVNWNGYSSYGPHNSDRSDYRTDYKDGLDQISEAIKLLKTDPDSRRILVSAWNVADLPDMALAPCHCLFQFYTEELTMRQRQDYYRDVNGLYICGADRYPEDAMALMDEDGVPTRKLSCQLYQRSTMSAFKE